MRSKNLIFALLAFGLTFSWLLLTCFLDFFAVPTIFQQSGDLFEAGRIGGQIFFGMNNIEVLVALLVLILSFFVINKVNRAKLVICFLLLIIASTYRFYLSPKIMYYAEKMELYANDKIQDKDFDESRELYHNTYIRMDAIKILLLILLLVYQGRELIYKKGEQQ